MNRFQKPNDKEDEDEQLLKLLNQFNLSQLKLILYNLETEYEKKKILLENGDNRLIAAHLYTEVCAQLKIQISQIDENVMFLKYRIIKSARRNISKKTVKKSDLQRKLKLETDFLDLQDVDEAWKEDDYNDYTTQIKNKGTDRKLSDKIKDSFSNAAYQLGTKVVVTNNKTKEKYNAEIYQKGGIVEDNGKKIKVGKNQYIVIFDDKSWAIVGLKPTYNEQYYISGLI